MASVAGMPDAGKSPSLATQAEALQRDHILLLHEKTKQSESKNRSHTIKFGLHFTFVSNVYEADLDRMAKPPRQ